MDFTLVSKFQFNISSKNIQYQKFNELWSRDFLGIEEIYIKLVRYSANNKSSFAVEKWVHALKFLDRFLVSQIVGLALNRALYPC